MGGWNLQNTQVQTWLHGTKVYKKTFWKTDPTDKKEKNELDPGELIIIKWSVADAVIGSNFLSSIVEVCRKIDLKTSIWVLFLFLVWNATIYHRQFTEKPLFKWLSYYIPIVDYKFYGTLLQ